MSSKSASCSKMNVAAYMPWIKLIIAVGIIACFVIIAVAPKADGDVAHSLNSDFRHIVSMFAILMAVASMILGPLAMVAVFFMALGCYYHNGYKEVLYNTQIHGSPPNLTLVILDSKYVKWASIVAMVLSGLGIILHSGDLWMQMRSKKAI